MFLNYTDNTLHYPVLPSYNIQGTEFVSDVRRQPDLYHGAARLTPIVLYQNITKTTC